jgi:hypothetical protein
MRPCLRWSGFSQDQVVVTVNVGDFITLAAGVDLHPGVIVLREVELSAALRWDRQKQHWHSLTKFATVGLTGSPYSSISVSSSGSPWDR